MTLNRRRSRSQRFHIKYLECRERNHQLASIWHHDHGLGLIPWTVLDQGHQNYRQIFQRWWQIQTALDRLRVRLNVILLYGFWLRYVTLVLLKGFCLNAYWSLSHSVAIDCKRRAFGRLNLIKVTARKSDKTVTRSTADVPRSPSNETWLISAFTFINVRLHVMQRTVLLSQFCPSVRQTRVLCQN